MERTEPAFVPEWLRCTGNVAGSGGSSIHHSDVSSPSHNMRNRSFGGNKDTDSPRYLDRSSSSNARRSLSSDGPGKHPYSSFSRSHRDKHRDRVKEKSPLEDIWNNGSADPLESILTSRVERRSLSRSQSQVSRKPGEKLPQRIENSQVSGNGALSGGRNSNTIQKAVLEKEFPSLRTEEKQDLTGIKRVLSPRLTSAVQSSAIGNSGFLCGEKWTSALAEVPAIPTNNGTTSTLPPSVAMVSNLSSTASSPGGLNMAEALSQPAARVRTPTQLSDKNQRLEELAIKQSRQLIPVTPSMPKPLVSSSVDKTKQSKAAARTNETSMVSRGVHQQPHSAHLANPSRVIQTKPDSASASHSGKFLVLKPGRENIALGAKDALSGGSDADGKVANGQHIMSPATPIVSTSPSTSVVSALENRAGALTLSSKSTVDKRSSQSLAQSRSEFFNLMRRKKSSSATNNHSDSSLTVPSSGAQTFGEKFQGSHGASSHIPGNGICNGNSYDSNEKIKSLSDPGEDGFSANGSVYPDEEEAAFLRSLGWEENGGEDEGLTEEEINAFYQEYMNRRPLLEARQNSQPKVSTPTKLPNASGDASSDSSSSESESEG
ncbi:uncharacterized protein LOC127257078 [Andrographis paniculata]|uniref:uncharacterized protein LOC127257078 n=1 Tax=Andrographis paniculata TaxID=175694 RepID=UPI0021E8D323|nr:uncharacterized protein LOC127257078 [Andrographis paniculata]